MTIPTIQIRIAFGDPPFLAAASVTWTDVTADLLLDPTMGGAPVTIRRGRQSELGRVEAGQLTLTLRNASRQYEPENAAGTYYPDVQPMTRIQVRAYWNTTWYSLFTGYIKSWTPEYPGGQLAVVRIAAVDAMNAISRTLVSVTSLPPGESTGNAIRTALNHIGWPYTTDYVYTAGYTTVASGTYANLNALQYIQTITETENGQFYIDGAGMPTFQDRYYRMTYSTSVATYGTGAGEFPYESVELSFDEELIYNDIRVTRSGGAEQQAIDTTSNTNYGPRTLTKSGLYFSTDNESLSMSQYLLILYRNPLLRVPRIVLNGELDPTNLWPRLLTDFISTAITIRVRPPGGGSMIEKRSRIEAVAHTIALDSWRTQYELSTDSPTNWLTLNDSTYGTLDSNALAF